ncbi:MAG: helicase-related protein [Desulfobacter sp.]
MEHLFTPGQRWVSETEPELGMGILVFHDKRTVKIDFPGGGCTRQYSLSAAPIRRMTFVPGDRISTADGRDIVVERVEEARGLMTYGADDLKVPEQDLSPFTSVSLPRDRLLAGLSGPPKPFGLRRDVRFGRAACDASGARGFLGGKVDLIPHQFYIADQVSRRYFPRVLLSDETGLGKTIEAGLVLHKMLVLGQISRVLIIVPDALVHQWFIEFYRKFNLKFRLFDKAFCRAVETETPGMNPFSSDQQGICSQAFIRNHPLHREQILDAGWDMVVMDEAHHLTDDPGFHGFMQELGGRTRGLMLLTATPEQMGADTHFAQLRLLDPDRYFDRDAYAEEAKTYETTAKTVTQRLARGKPVDELLDTFGPGRVIFRNRRVSIKGFPGRNASLIPLDSTPEQIHRANQESGLATENGNRDKETVPDLRHDPRVACLAGLAKNLRPEKLLVICSTREKAEALDKALQAHISVDTARFDESMTLLQRDRHAAWFAREDGARLLICSEIGSEGRNFQFVHHLFLFDLPLNPELLEQRIGRVDRIGQKNEITVHVPYIRGSVQEILARWYGRGLPLLEKNINGLHAIFTRFESRLSGLIKEAARNQTIDETALTDLLDQAAAYTQATQDKLDRGKHILVELNSFKPGPAKKLIQTIASTDSDPGLEHLMETLLDHYGVDMDRISEKPGEKIISLSMDRIADEQFPALPPGGDIVTFERATAIARDDVGFLTWDHPFVNRVTDFFLGRDEGISTTAVFKQAPGPGLILETLFVLEAPDTETIPGAHPFANIRPLFIRVDHTGAPVPDSALPADFNHRLKPDHPAWFMDMEQVKSDLLPELLDKSQAMAETSARQMRADAAAELSQTGDREIRRLCDLQKVNPAITEQEIQAARTAHDMLAKKIAQARIRMDAVRLIRMEG